MQSAWQAPEIQPPVSWAKERVCALGSLQVALTQIVQNGLQTTLRSKMRFSLLVSLHTNGAQHNTTIRTIIYTPSIPLENPYSTPLYTPLCNPPFPTRNFPWGLLTFAQGHSASEASSRRSESQTPAGSRVRSYLTYY